MKVLAGLLAAAGLAWPAAATATDDFRPFAAIEVSPAVHVLSTPPDFYGPAIGNIVVIEQSDGMVVVDSGTSIGHGRAIVRYIRSLTSNPVKAVVITHWHNDHPQGVAALQEAWPGIRVIATPATKAGMLGPESESIALKPDASMDKQMFDRVEGSKVEYRKILEAPDTPEDRRERIRKALVQFDDFYNDFRGSYLVPPTEMFDKRLVIPDRKAPVEVLYLGRANTAGDAIVWLPSQRIVASGDVVVSPVPFGFNSYPADWIKTLARIKELGFTILIPGHGEPMHDARYVDHLIASITNIRNQVGAAVKAGLNFKQVKERVELSGEAGRFTDVARFKAAIPENWTEPMVVNAYKEAKGIPIRQTGNPEPDPK